VDFNVGDNHSAQAIPRKPHIKDKSLSN